MRRRKAFQLTENNCSCNNGTLTIGARVKQSILAHVFYQLYVIPPLQNIFFQFFFTIPYFLFPDQSPPSLQLQCSPVHRLIIVIKVFPTLGELARLRIKRDQIRKAVKRDFCRSQTIAITITMQILRVKGSFPFTKVGVPQLIHLLHFPPLFSTDTLQLVKVYI